MARLGRFFGEHDASDGFLRSIRGLAGVTVEPPAAEAEVERVEAFAGVRLPALHRNLLLRANGIRAAWGYRRLYGVGDEPEQIGPWNTPEMWKFAWPDALDDYLMIAGSGWGDQYAYRISELRRGVETIHRLERSSMGLSRDAVADDPAMFLRAFLMEARKPGPPVHEARAAIGDLGPNELAILLPPPAITGAGPSRLTKLFAPGVLIANGDVRRQLTDPANWDRRATGVVPYEDELGRPRMAVRWA